MFYQHVVRAVLHDLFRLQYEEVVPKVIKPLMCHQLPSHPIRHIIPLLQLWVKVEVFLQHQLPLIGLLEEDAHPLQQVPGVLLLLLWAETVLIIQQPELFPVY